jgi:multidrug transporter EmrE-like cation transporter
MIYLILAILCSFTNSLLIKQNEINRANTRVVLASNYVTAIILGWAFVLVNGIEGLSTQSLILGIGGGLLWPVSFYMLMWGIRHYGLSLAGSISRLSLCIPIIFALLFLHERLTVYNAMGILGTFLAFFLLNPVKSGQNTPLDTRAVWYFPLLVVTFGLVDGWVNLFNTIAPHHEKYLFMVLIFTFSGIIAWTGILLLNVAVSHQALQRGLVLGVPNFLSTYFLLQSLQTPFFNARSAVVYTLFSIAGVILAFGSGVVIWKEKITRGNVWGILFALGAIILLNQH